MQTTIIPFQIVVGGRTSDGYSVRASAAGRTVESMLALPELPADAAALGQVLGAALFPPPIHRLLLDTAHGAEVAGARLQLQLQVAAPELATLPWEQLSLGRQTLWQPGLRDDYPLVRIGRRPRPLAPLDVRGPLRLLIVCAPGVDPMIAALGHALAGPVRAGTLVADLLRDASPSDLAAALAEEPCHMLHIIAPIDVAGPDPNPRLRLARSLDPAGLSALLADYPDLRMVALSGADDPAATARFAALLHEYHGTAALALAGLDAPTHALFCGAFYSELTVGESAELALTSGRVALAESAAAWGNPQLYLAAGGEQLFQLRPLPSEPEPLLPGPSLIDRVARGRRSGREEKSAPPPQPAPSSRVGAPWPQLVGRLGAAFKPNSEHFAVAQTSVGAPARRTTTQRMRRPLLSWRSIALIVALLVLALLLAQVWERPSPQVLAADAPPQAAQPSDLPVASLIPLLQTAIDREIAAIAQRGPPLGAEPPAYATYLVLEGDTLAGIAQRVAGDPYLIAAYNYLDPSEPLRVGRPLVLPITTPQAGLPNAPVITRGNPAAPLVALTFDIELDAATLYDILDLLRERDLRATFFVTGRWVQTFPEAARAIVSAGHEIGNHSLTHPAFTTISPAQMISEIEETERIIRETTGVSSRPYFRLPYGESNEAVLRTLAEHGFVTYHWSSDDNGISYWLAAAAAEPSAIYGGLMLMHGRESTVMDLPAWLDQLAAMGITPTTLSAVLR